MVAEVPIRQHLIRTAVDTIIPAYKAFYEKYAVLLLPCLHQCKSGAQLIICVYRVAGVYRYSVIQFSKKHASRYLKYTPQAVQALLKELFSGEAAPGDKHSEVSSS